MTDQIIHELYNTLSKFLLQTSGLNPLAGVVYSCESCQCVKAGNKFDKGGEQLKSVPVPYQIMNQLGIDLITNLPKTTEGYNTIVTAIDDTSKWVASRPLKGKFAEGVAEFMHDLVCYFGASKIHISDHGREFVNQVCVILVCTVI